MTNEWLVNWILWTTMYLVSFFSIAYFTDSILSLFLYSLFYLELYTIFVLVN